MSIRKKRNVKGRFTIVPNSLLERNDLSWEAKGVLGYLISKPPDWEGRKSDLQIHSPKMSDYALKKIITELLGAELLTIKTKKDPVKGTLCGSFYELGIIPEIEVEIIEESPRGRICDARSDELSL